MALKDSFGREIRNLRVSITDRCNFRCVYCMPKDPHWLPHEDILTFEEIVRFIRVAGGLGFNKVRLTGGEPTVRKGCVELVRSVCGIPGIRDVSLTTNGMLLETLADPLWDAGLRRINVSLDTLREERFVHVTRREGFRQVWRGLEAADRAGFRPLKVNCVVMRGTNEEEVANFAALARERPLQIRFIEFMPLDGDNQSVQCILWKLFRHLRVSRRACIGSRMDSVKSA
jgi:cyclic pyranopterin phosphate synthase